MLVSVSFVNAAVSILRDAVGGSDGYECAKHTAISLATRAAAWAKRVDNVGNDLRACETRDTDGDACSARSAFRGAGSTRSAKPPRVAIDVGVCSAHLDPLLQLKVDETCFE